MKKNYTVLFLFLFLSSIMGGLALKNVLTYSMVIGYGLGVIFLICSIYFAMKDQKNSKPQ
ncbi:hypothetical protein [Paenisporosarcina sp. TG-14]|uniref:hypothetical protein n=1 Tax=Paenisporosarcina sp. TG-14 TaxID=1231057 RepID=UPI0002D783C2|nr:hypothetical protein [Paenisporosarcina sp. TG-14]